MKLTHYLSIFVVAAVFASCTKEGPAGPQGDPGQNGVANINTLGCTITSANWVPTSGTDYNWVASFNDPDITDADNDAVEAYWSTPSNSQWFALPDANLIGPGDNFSYGYQNGLITFSYYTGGSSTAPISLYYGYTTIYCKVTVIPPSIQVKYPNVNFKNSTQVLNMVPEVQAALTTTKLK